MVFGALDIILVNPKSRPQIHVLPMLYALLRVVNTRLRSFDFMIFVLVVEELFQAGPDDFIFSDAFSHARLDDLGPLFSSLRLGLAFG